MTLEVQICTFGPKGLQRCAEMSLPHLPDTFYSILLQNPEGRPIDVPAQLRRDDVRILEHRSKGLSNNRNFGIGKAEGDIILIADDDLRYSAEGIRNVRLVFEADPSLDFATFMHRGGDNKQFPSEGFEFKHKEPKGYYLTSFELALRRESLPASIRFSPELGIGAPYYGAGEENLFLMRLMREGLRGRFFPEVVVQHPGVTTGVRTPSHGLLRSVGALLWLRNGLAGIPRILLESLRRKGNLIANLRHITAGYFRAPRIFHKDGSDKLQ